LINFNSEAFTMSFARSVVFVVALASPLSPFASRLNADAAQHAGHAPGSQSALVEAVRHATESFDPPVLEGHLLHFVDGPNRFGLPARYELRVWAWRDNPNGPLADWNPRESCEGR
jgi:hypothetical protein